MSDSGSTATEKKHWTCCAEGLERLQIADTDCDNQHQQPTEVAATTHAARAEKGSTSPQLRKPKLETGRWLRAREDQQVAIGCAVCVVVMVVYHLSPPRHVKQASIRDARDERQALQCEAI